MALDVGAVGPEPLAAGDLAVAQLEEAAVRELVLAEPQTGVAARRTSSASLVEAKKMAPRACPSHSGRPMPRARKTEPAARSSSQAVAIEPTRASSALRVVGRVRGEREDRLRVDRHPRLDAGAVERGEELVVVDDDPVVDADRPARDGPGGCSRRSTGGPSCSRARERGARSRSGGRRSARADGSPACAASSPWEACRRASGTRTRPRPRPVLRSRPGAPALPACDRRRRPQKGCIRQFRT